MRRRLACLVLCALLALPTTASAVGTPERRTFQMVNATRRAHDRARVRLAGGLSRSAERHARRMARRQRLSHPDVASGRWDALGYIVGVGPTLRAVHRAFLRSTTHRRVMLGRWDVVGIGIVRRGGRFWVVEIYAR
jgi:uncharacterized protein YkwD